MQERTSFLLTNEAGKLVPKRVAAPDKTAIVDFAIAADTSGRLHLVVATGRTVYAYESGELRAITRAKERSVGTSTPADGTVPDGPGPRITSVATGDVDGDGLQDLLVVTSEGSRVLKRMASADRGVADFSLDPKDKL